ncbi:hypothetical protein FRC11_003185, partial [Ceratobasidium sp. 423]
PKPDTGYVFEDPQDAKFNLSSNVGMVDNSLIWGQSGFESRVSNPRIWEHEQTSERYLEVALPRADQLTPVLNLDEHLDIIEEYDSASGEVKLRLGPKPPTSKIYEVSDEFSPQELEKKSKENTIGAVKIKPSPVDLKDQNVWPLWLRTLVDGGVRPESVNPEDFKKVFCIPVQIAFLG